MSYNTGPAAPPPVRRHLQIAFSAMLLFGSWLACGTADADSMTLNLKDADISAFIGTVSKITGKNFIVDPRVKGKITVISSHPMNEKQIYQVFLSVLEVHGFAAVPSGSVIKIIPMANARQSAIPLMSGDNSGEGDEYMTQVITLQNVPAAQLVPILRPLVPQQGHLVAYPPANMLIITDVAANIKRIAKIVGRIDVTNNEQIEVIPLKHASASEVVHTLTTLEQQQSQSRGQAGRPGAGGPILIADERTNSILMAGDKADRLRLRAVVSQLDTPLEQSGNIHVVYLRYAKAKDLLPILQGIVSSAKNKPKAIQGANAEQINIEADESTNALVISAPPDLYSSLEGVIRRLDIRRIQVFIEATIAEVSSNMARELGIQWAIGNPEGDGTIALTNLGSGGSSLSNVAGAVLGATSGSSSGSTSSSALGSALGAVPTGATFGIGAIAKGSLSYAALVRALASDSHTNILSTPSLVTLDNEEAQIVVGQNIPIKTGTFTSTGATGSVTNPFQTIQRKDVGVQLKVKPQINEGNTVKMDIDQEVSAITPAPANVNAADIITNKRQIKTSVLIDSGQIVVLGGLIKNDLEESVAKVPLLGDIPIIGYLFRYTNTTRDKTNLMVFIHPEILRNAEDNQNVTGGKYDYIRDQQMKIRQHGVYLLPDQESPLMSPMSDYLRLPPPFDQQQQAPSDNNAPSPPDEPAAPPDESGKNQ